MWYLFTFQPLLTDSYGYAYNKQSFKTQKLYTYWRCSNRTKTINNPIRCYGTVIERRGVFHLQSEHRCTPVPNIHTLKQISQDLKIEGSNKLSLPAKDIVEDTLRINNVVPGDDSSMKNLIRRINYRRRKSRPVEVRLPPHYHYQDNKEYIIYPNGTLKGKVSNSFVIMIFVTSTVEIDAT